MIDKGLVVRAISGFYFVLPIKCFNQETGEVVFQRLFDEYFLDYKEHLITCKGRGLLKNKGEVILVGDVVEYELKEDGTGLIVKVLDRKNSLLKL